jgi:hypothetical protein
MASYAVGDNDAMDDDDDDDNHNKNSSHLGIPGTYKKHYVSYTSVPQLFLPRAHPTLTMARDGTPQNFTLQKGCTKYHEAIKMRILYVNR